MNLFISASGKYLTKEDLVNLVDSSLDLGLQVEGLQRSLKKN